MTRYSEMENDWWIYSFNEATFCQLIAVCKKKRTIFIYCTNCTISITISTRALVAEFSVFWERTDARSSASFSAARRQPAIGWDLSVVANNHPEDNSSLKGPSQRFATASYIGVSISGWPTNYFEWSARNRISNVLVRPSAGNGRRRIFDLETVQLEVKHSGRYTTGATPRELRVHRVCRGISNLLCVLPTGPWAGTVRDPRDIRFNDLRLGWIESSAEAVQGFRRLAESFPPISRRHPAFRERSPDSFEGCTWIVSLSWRFSLLVMYISRQGY